MALVTTICEVVGVLTAMALLLWFSAYIESRQLGPIALPPDRGAGPVTDLEAVADGTGALEVVEPVT